MVKRNKWGDRGSTEDESKVNALKRLNWRSQKRFTLLLLSQIFMEYYKAYKTQWINLR